MAPQFDLSPGETFAVALYRAKAVVSMGPTRASFRAADPDSRVQDPRDRVRGYARAATVTGLVFTLLGMSAAAAFAAGTFYVDTQHPSASNANPGTEALPYKTITGAAAAHNGAGTTIIVKPGTYRETVTVPASGAANSFFVFQAYAPGVIVDGSDDFSGTSKWALQSGTVYLASTVTWTPKQVFVNGVRLTPWGGTPETLPVNSFLSVPGAGLYVNLGGSNPGSQMTLVGRRTYGFRLSSRSNVRIEGFTVARTEDRAMYTTKATNNVYRSNTVNNAYRYGIALDGCTAALVELNTVSFNQDHGIALTDATTGCSENNDRSITRTPRSGRPTAST
jgi:parallel beta-helix repeat protein